MPQVAATRCTGAPRCAVVGAAFDSRRLLACPHDAPTTQTSYHVCRPAVQCGRCDRYRCGGACTARERLCGGVRAADDGRELRTWLAARDRLAPELVRELAQLAALFGRPQTLRALLGAAGGAAVRPESLVRVRGCDWGYVCLWDCLVELNGLLCSGHSTSTTLARRRWRRLRTLGATTGFRNLVRKDRLSDCE